MVAALRCVRPQFQWCQLAYATGMKSIQLHDAWLYRKAQPKDSIIYITSHHITSHHITSHHITSHHITSHHITSHHITSHHITSHHITSHHITLHYITLHYITLHYIMVFHIVCPIEEQTLKVIELIFQLFYGFVQKISLVSNLYVCWV